MGTILIVTEIQAGKIREASHELITLASGLGGDIKSVVIGSGVGELASEFAGKGGVLDELDAQRGGGTVTAGEE